jgi:hypothetical protein
MVAIGEEVSKVTDRYSKSGQVGPSLAQRGGGGLRPSEHDLLLTVARVLLAKISNEIYAEQEADMEALTEALAPFDRDEKTPKPDKE